MCGDGAVIEITLRDKFETKLKNGGAWVLHNCSMCGYPCKFFSDGNALFYDAGCDCVRGPFRERFCAWDELDFYFEPKHGHIPSIEKWVTA